MYQITRNIQMHNQIDIINPKHLKKEREEYKTSSRMEKAPQTLSPAFHHVLWASHFEHG